MRGTVRGINARRWVICEAGMCVKDKINLQTLLDIRGYELPTNLQNFTQKYLTEVKIFEKVLGDYFFLKHPVDNNVHQSRIILNTASICLHLRVLNELCNQSTFNLVDISSPGCNV